MRESLEFLNLDSQLQKAWCKIGDANALFSHKEIAAFLIQSYQGSRDGAHLLGQSCVLCNNRLSFLCTYCYAKRGNEQGSHQNSHQLHSSSSKEANPTSTAEKSTETDIPVVSYSSLNQQNPVDDNSLIKCSSPVAHSHLQNYSLLKLPEAEMSLEQKKDSQDLKADNLIAGMTEGKIAEAKIVDFEIKEEENLMETSAKEQYFCQECCEKLQAEVNEQSDQHFTDQSYICDGCGVTFSRKPQQNMLIQIQKAALNSENIWEQRIECGNIKQIGVGTKNTEFLEKEVKEGDRGVKHFVEKKAQAFVILVNGKKQFCCNVCGQQFSQLCRLRQHSQIHTSHRPHSCEHCAAKFLRKYHLQRHIKNKHSSLTEVLVVSKKLSLHKSDKKKQESEDEKELSHAVKLAAENVNHLEINTLEENKLVFEQAHCFSANHYGQDVSDHHGQLMHKRAYITERRYACQQCDAAFYRTTHLKMHIMRKHQSFRPFVCKLCSAGFTDAYHLRRHEETHSKNQPYKCMECKATFSIIKQLKNHLQVHLSDNSQSDRSDKNIDTENLAHSLSQTSEVALSPLKVNEINNISDEKIVLSSQEMQRINDGTFLSEVTAQIVEPDACQEKNLTAATSWNAYVISPAACSKRKGKKPLKNVQKKFACVYQGCDAESNTISEFRDHLSFHSDEKLHLRKSCGQSSSTDLAAEQRESLRREVRPFVCKECGDTYLRHSHLVKHQRRHTGERPYVCSVCGASFVDASHLKRHNQKHTGERPYMCEWCGSSFIQSGQLKTHVMAMHTDCRPYRCNQCSKAYTTSSLLRVHIRTHTGERPYKCTLCDAAFKIISHLKDHMLTHTGEKPKQCTLCTAAYTRTSHLKKHMTRVHPGTKSKQSGRKTTDTVLVTQRHSAEMI